MRMDQDRAFPRLNAAQIARIASHGQRRKVARGDLLVQSGDAVVPFFVVVNGASWYATRRTYDDSARLIASSPM